MTCFDKLKRLHSVDFWTFITTFGRQMCLNWESTDPCVMLFFFVALFFSSLVEVRMDRVDSFS